MGNLQGIRKKVVKFFFSNSNAFLFAVNASVHNQRCKSIFINAD